MNSDYELIESFVKGNETWSYLRHKRTGLEIAYHQCDTEEKGFSFCFRTPVEDFFLGTTHVLEHCVLSGSRKYDVTFLDLQYFSLFSSTNAMTDEYGTRYYFCSIEEAEVFKMIPVLADYVFFPLLSEEAFMQECFRVEFDPSGDGRKKEIVGVVYNEIKTMAPGKTCIGGIYYKLHELTNKKIREYHKKYYKPDNCLFAYSGNSSLDEILLQLNKFVPELEEKFKSGKPSPRKNLIIEEFLQQVPFLEVPENLEEPNHAHWIFNEGCGICRPFEDYWLDGVSPLMPFCLDDKYAYTEYCWWEKNTMDNYAVPLPPKKSIQKIIPEYLASFSPQEYQTKLEKLHKWLARDTRDEARKIMEPLAIAEYDIKFNKTEEELRKDFERHKSLITTRDSREPDVYTEIDKNSCILFLRASQLLSRNYYAEYAFMFFMEYYLSSKLRKVGGIYCGGIGYKYPADFVLGVNYTDNPQKTIEVIKECFKELSGYNFTETDIISIKYNVFNFLLSHRNIEFFFTEEILTVKPGELHQAAVRFRDMIYPPKKDETYYYTLGEAVK